MDSDEVRGGDQRQAAEDDNETPAKRAHGSILRHDARSRTDDKTPAELE
jgi:hypothetical protein